MSSTRPTRTVKKAGWNRAKPTSGDGFSSRGLYGHIRLILLPWPLVGNPRPKSKWVAVMRLGPHKLKLPIYFTWPLYMTVIYDRYIWPWPLYMTVTVIYVKEVLPYPRDPHPSKISNADRYTTVTTVTQVLSGAIASKKCKASKLYNASKLHSYKTRLNGFIGVLFSGLYGISQKA